MKSNDVFPGKYLRADDLNGAEPIVTMRDVKIETLGDDSKPVLYFVGKEKGLVMNKTNWAAITEITGSDDSDEWTGKKVKLVTRKVDFQGKRVPAIRVEEPIANGHRPPPPVEPVHAPDEDDIPFGVLLPLLLPMLGAFVA